MNQSFATQRLTITAGQSAPVSPPRACRGVTVFSLAAADLSLYSEIADESTVVTIAPGWTQSIVLQSGVFNPNQVAFWLKCSLDCTVVLLWT